jgi:hypothetical protein
MWAGLVLTQPHTRAAQCTSRDRTLRWETGFFNPCFVITHSVWSLPRKKLSWHKAWGLFCFLAFYLRLFKDGELYGYKIKNPTTATK